MNRYFTREALKQYIKMMLGWPQLNVELTDEQMEICIDKSIQMFTNVAYDGEMTKYIKFDCRGAGTYFVDPQIEEITKICQSGIFTGSDLNGYIDQNLSNYILSSSGVALSYLVTLSATRALVGKYFGTGVAFEFNSHAGQLNIFQNWEGPLLLEAKMRYIPADYDKIYDQEWVKRRAVAECQLLISKILGKYSAPLINGATINYNEMYSQASEEIQKLDEELMNKWTEPSIVLIG